MRIKPAPESNEGKPVGPGTRATRSSAHAQKRQDNRHAERDYFGNIVTRPQANSRPTVGSALAEMDLRAKRAAMAQVGTAGPTAQRLEPSGAAKSKPSSPDGPVRLDAWLVAHGLSSARDKAKELISSGYVYVNGSNKVKASMQVAPDAEVEVRDQAVSFVGRGGLKLQKALDAFGIDVAGMTAVDLGASTGGFTDCLLQRGASRVLAIDVGHGQLHPAIEADPRVASLEGVDARDVTRRTVAEAFARPDGDGNVADTAVDLVCADLSFISLAHVLPCISALLEPGRLAVVLIKPQFEAGKEQVGKKGVVKSPDVHREVVGRVLSEAREAGLEPRGLDYSPVKGPEGNIEYLLCAVKTPADIDRAPIGPDDVRAVVAAAHAGLA